MGAHLGTGFPAGVSNPSLSPNPSPFRLPLCPMARRMSNKDRIGKMREEADATAKEKSAPKEKSAAKEPKPKKGAPVRVASRMKIVWAVCAVNGSIVKTFPYPLKAAAEAEVKRLTEAKGASHHLRAEKVPFDD